MIHALGKTEEDFEGYSALGVLARSIRTNVVDPGTFNNDETFRADAMGNVESHLAQRKDLGSQTFDSVETRYGPGTGRLLGTTGFSSQSATFYTDAGDRSVVVQRGSQQGGSHGSIDDARYYYSADGIPNGLQQPTSLTGAFEDYRYDALGRRVQVRTRMNSVCQGSSCLSSLMWVVWDGTEIAAEIRGPGGDGLAADSLEAGAGSGAMYGTADYLNGPTLDKPLEIQGILVYRTWRGLIDGGECLRGVCGTTGVIDYPGLTYEAYLDAMPSTQGAPVSWHGTLFAEGLDDAGLMYRRNRYYDPATGQFTQEDPLGLAGGTNAYGFGSGDPISYADPFGTCPFWQAICSFFSSLLQSSPPSAAEQQESAAITKAVYAKIVADEAEGEDPEDIAIDAEETAGALEIAQLHAEKAASNAVYVGKNETRVSRWMSETEYTQMKSTGTLQTGGGDRTYVTMPGAPKPSGTGPVRVDFNVPKEALQPASRHDWRMILEPSVSRLLESYESLLRRLNDSVSLPPGQPFRR